MLKIFICPYCHNIRMVSKKPNATCLHCSNALVDSGLDFSVYAEMSLTERECYKKEWNSSYVRVHTNC